MPALPHDFRTPELLELALTHSSTGRSADNERLEFLGDAVLDLIVADELYHRWTDLPEGDLTELKAWVVSRRVLADAARELQLGDNAVVGSGMRRRALPRSVLANLYEAVLGAVYLDGGYAAATQFTLTTLGDYIDRARDQQGESNPKQTLQQLAQSETGTPPNYRTLDQRGHAHARAFLVAAELGARQFPSAWGRTRKEAERWAAHEALLVLETEDAIVT